MSYNTRRQGSSQGVGRGSPSSYQHVQQQPPRVGSAPQARQMNSSPQTNQAHGFQTHHTLQQSYSSQSSSPYSADRSAPGTGYSTQQYQQQQPQPPQQQLQQKTVQSSNQPQVTNSQPDQPKFQPAPPTQQPLHGILKPEKPEQNVPMESDSIPEADDAEKSDSQKKNRPPWMKHKGPLFKINRKLRRRRQNAKLRKILQPKNAIAVLNELKAGVKFVFQEQPNTVAQLFLANVEVDGKVYAGQGVSKTSAKQAAAENALKAMLLEKLAEAACKAETSSVTQEEGNGTAEGLSDDDSMSASGTEKSDKRVPPEEDFPWGTLASFALFKLFSDWHYQGTQQAKPSLVPMKKIPDNPTSHHPVMLLNQLRPGTLFNETKREGIPPNVVFTVEVVLDGKPYYGSARNKKDAKKEAAKAALAGALQIVYE